MIPKTIHYCWFGGAEKPKLAQKCIASWKKYCPDYEIIEWNESNFDVQLNDYTSFTFAHKLYAYLSDYVRLWAVENYGGFYFDTDVELIKPLDELEKLDAFFAFETPAFITTGLGFGAEAHHPSVKAMLDAYDRRDIESIKSGYEKGEKLRGSPKMNTYALTPYGLQQNGKRQQVLGAELFPKEFFCPFDDVTGELKKTDNTISIHWYLKSAHGKKALWRAKISRPIHRLLKIFGKS